MQNGSFNPNRPTHIKPAYEPPRIQSSENGLTCPLTGKPITDPVIAPNGITYEGQEIRAFVQAHGHLPTDNRPVTPRKLWPDQNMRDRLFATTVDDEDEHLDDPITFDTMTRPVVASDGRTYDQTTLEMLFRENDGISPFSRDAFATTGYRNQQLVTELGPQDPEGSNTALANDPTLNLVTFERVEAPSPEEMQAELNGMIAQLRRNESRRSLRNFLRSSGGLAAAIIGVTVVAPFIGPLILAATSTGVMIVGVVITVIGCSLAGQVLATALFNGATRLHDFFQERLPNPEDR